MRTSGVRAQLPAARQALPAENTNRSLCRETSGIRANWFSCDLSRIHKSNTLNRLRTAVERAPRMAVEIERKFLVDTALLGPLAEGVEMSQGYISTGDGAVVRVRLAGERAWLTLKGPAAGFVRSEFEYLIPAADARQMIAEFCGGRVIRKTRYLREVAGYVWEIDVFAGDNAGLIVAEVELSDPAEQPPLPDWVGLEVTGDARYLNNHLYTHPHCDWCERGAAEGRDSAG